MVEYWAKTFWLLVIYDNVYHNNGYTNSFDDKTSFFSNHRGQEQRIHWVVRAGRAPPIQGYVDAFPVMTYPLNQELQANKFRLTLHLLRCLILVLCLLWHICWHNMQSWWSCPLYVLSRQLPFILMVSQNVLREDFSDGWTCEDRMWIGQYAKLANLVVRIYGVKYDPRVVQPSCWQASWWFVHFLCWQVMTSVPSDGQSIV